MTKFFRHYFQSTNSPFGDFTNTSPPVAAEIFGKLKAMEHHASPPSSLIWLWLLVSFGEPLVTLVTALFEGRSDYRKEVSVLGSVVVHNSRYPSTSEGGVEGLVLLLSGLGGRYSLLGHACHSLGGVVTTAGWRWSGLTYALLRSAISSLLALMMPAICSVYSQTLLAKARHWMIE